MSKSNLTLYKEILKKEHESSELGIAEKKIRTFYDSLILKGERLPENLARLVYQIREENEQKQLDYIKASQQRDREAIDVMLLESFNKELEILSTYNGTTVMNNDTKDNG